MSWLWIGLSALGAIVLCLLVWIAGPLVSIGDAEPLAGLWTRLAIVVLIVAVAGATIAWRIVVRRRAAAKIEAAMTAAPAEESDAPILRDKMEEAIATLRGTGKSSAHALYDLPWYLIIGPPGAGKTTALVNSGLRFPLAGDNAAKAVQGVGGTRYCDWWFTDAAVLIDTAGRYTTQDSDAKADRRSWLAFLDMLRKNRPRQPINGVIVAISIADLLTLPPAEVAAHADAIQRRLTELHEELKIELPVYVVFTKMDLVVGFMDYFADLDEAKRQVVWGATFQTADKKANHVAEVPQEMDLLIQRIAERLPERLQDEPDLRARAVLFGFPAQIGAIRKPVADFLNRIFEPTRYRTTATLRGFYFTSGTQEGTPFDALIGALQRSYGVEGMGAAGFSGVGKSFFLHDLLSKVIFGEAGWVSTNIAAVRRAFALNAAAYALIAAVTAGVIGLWWVSYTHNSALIAGTAAGIDAYEDKAREAIRQPSVNDTRLDSVYQLVAGLPYLPEGYARRNDPTPLSQTFGLSQRPRLRDVSDSLYGQALERLFRPRLILALEQDLQKGIDNPTYVYEALKVYLMLGGRADVENKDQILSWFSRSWEDVYPGAPNAEGRALLRGHLNAMLDLETPDSRKASLNGALVEQAQATLTRLPIAQRAYALLKSEAGGEVVDDWIAAQQGGPDMGFVFETVNGASLDAVRVPGFFTYDGFYVLLLKRMQTIADKLRSETWVLGPFAKDDAVKEQYVGLFPSILDLYSNESIASWNAAINNLQLRPLLADKPKYQRLAAASSPTSPIVLVLQSIARETEVTQERAKPPDDTHVADKAKETALASAGAKFGAAGREAIDLAVKSQRRAGAPPPETPGAAIEAAFKPYQNLFQGPPGARPIDNLRKSLADLYDKEVAAANQPQSRDAIAQVDTAASALRSNVSRLSGTPVVARMIGRVANDAAGAANASSISQISDAMAQDLSGCPAIVANRYPFANSERDVPMADFARLFGPGGAIEKFFTANLDPIVNRSGKIWTWRPGASLTRKLSDRTLRQFQQAAEIRDAFFPTGGSVPNLSFEVKPLTLSGAQTATLTVNGATIVSQQGGESAPATIAWPGAGAGAASIVMAPDLPDRPSKLERTGAWALFRLIDKGSPIQSGPAVKVSFVVFGREVSYQFTSSSLVNPLTMTALRQFQCPNGL